MGEVAVNLAALEAEVARVLASLPAAPQQDQHAACIAHHRSLARLSATLENYQGILPLWAWAPYVLKLGKQLEQQQQPYGAADVCFKRLVALNIHQLPSTDKLTPEVALKLHVESLYGYHSNHAMCLQQQDPQVLQSTTLQQLVGALAGLRQGVMLACTMEQLYWMVHNGTALLKATSSVLAAAGYNLEVLPFLVFACKALESSLPLSTHGFLEWRVRLYSTAAYCYCAATQQLGQQQQQQGGAPAASISASSVLQMGQQLLTSAVHEVDRLKRLQDLDPVPPPAELLQTYRSARTQLVAAHAALAAAATPATSSSGVTATWAAEVAALPDPAQQLGVLIGVLEAAGNCQQPLQQATLPDQLTAAWQAAMALAAPSLQQQQPPDGEGGNEASQATPPAPLAQDHLQALLVLAYKYNKAEDFNALLASAQQQCGAAGTSTLASSLPRPGGQRGFEAVVAIYAAVSSLSQAPGEDAASHLSACLQQHSAAAASSSPALVAAAGQLLLSTVSDAAQATSCMSDTAGRPVCDALRGVHTAFQVAALEDGLLKAAVGLRLALLLTGQGLVEEAKGVVAQALAGVEGSRHAALQQVSGRPDEHVRWISGSRTQPTDEATAAMAGMTATEQELACIHADLLLLQYQLQLMAGMQEVTQRVQQRQQDMLAATVRRDQEAQIWGARTAKQKRVDEAKLEAASKVPSHPSTRERELLQSCDHNPYLHAMAAIAVARCQPDHARQAALLEVAAQQLVAAQSAEAALLSCMEPPGAAGSRGSRGQPWQPKLACRSSHNMAVKAFPVAHWSTGTLGQAKPATFAVYCKQHGAGVALTINKASMEYEGCGRRTPLGEEVVIHGLQGNHTYVFAIAVYDAAGKLLGELGPSTPPVLMALPLPLFYLWGHLLKAAAQLQQWPAARKAAAVLFPRFISSTPARPVWEQHPMDALQLQQPLVAAAAAPLMRLLVQGLFLYASHTGQQLQQELAAADVAATKLEGAAAAGSGSRQLLKVLQQPRMEQQLQLLRSGKRLLLGMQVASLMSDVQLVEEGAVRAHNLLAPLLAAVDVCPLLGPPLAALHTCLKQLPAASQQKSEGQLLTQSMASRVAAAAVFHLLRVVAPGDDTAAAGSMAGAVGLAAGQQLQPASAVVQLEGALLKAQEAAAAATAVAADAGLSAARGGGCDIGPAGPADKGELLGLQDALLLHAALGSWGKTAVAARQADSSDLAAAVLPLAATHGDPLGASWPLLTAEAARQHPEWVPLACQVVKAALLLEPAAASSSKVQEAYAAIKQQVALAVRVPQLMGGPAWDKWKLAEAAEAVTEVVEASEEDGPAPDVAGLEAEAAQQALAAWEERKAQRLLQGKRRVAAATLLQQRCLSLVRRRRRLLGVRAKVAAWAPWLADLEVALAAALGQTLMAAPPSAEGAGVSNKEQLLQVFGHLARSVQLALRSTPPAWPQLVNNLRSTWNLALALVNAHELTLLQPQTPCAWAAAQLPEPKAAPLSIEEVAAAAKGEAGGTAVADAKGGKAGAAGKKSPDKKAPEKAAKGKPDKGAAAAGDAVVRQVLQPVRDAASLVARFRCVLDVLLTAVQQLKEGTSCWYPAVVPAPAASATSTSNGVPAAAVGHPAAALTGFQDGVATTGTSAAAPAAGGEGMEGSEFSFGSDAPRAMWHEGGPLDLQWVGRLVVVLLRGLVAKQQWHTVLSRGQQWLALSEGVATEQVLPLLLEVCRSVEGPATASLAAAWDAYMRDKDTGQVALDQARALVRDRVGVLPALHALSSGSCGKKKKPAKKAPDAKSRAPTRPGTSGSHRLTDSGHGGDAMSMVSGVTGVTARTAATQPDHVRLPAAYEQVVSTLKDKGNKALLVLALNELGDVHAQFGSWGPAGVAWGDALDALLGPYQVVTCWRGALTGRSWQQLLAGYGCHGLLLAGGVVLGKLVRYTYNEQLGLCLEAARLAAYLLPGVFACDLVHPQRALDFARYCPQQLWPGKEVFGDPYRCSVPDLLSGMEAVVGVLLQQGFALEVLPVVALWEHVALVVAREGQSVVLSRLARARALCELGLVTETAAVLGVLMQGRNLPHAYLPGTQQLRKAGAGGSSSSSQPPPLPAYTCGLWPGAAANQACIQYISTAAVEPHVEAAYGAWAVGELQQVRARWFLAVAGGRTCWRSSRPPGGVPEAAVRPEGDAPPPAAAAEAGGKAAAAGGKGAAAAAAAAAAAPAGKGAKGPGEEEVPAAVEQQLLDAAAELLQGLVNSSRAALGFAPINWSTAQPGEKPKGGAAAGGPTRPTSAASTAPGAKAPKGGAAGAAASDVAGADPAADRVLRVKQGQTLVRSTLLLAEVESARWRPQRGLNLALEALVLWQDLAAAASGVNGTNEELDRHRLGAAAWLKARLQVGSLLLQLQHWQAAIAWCSQTVAAADQLSEALVPAEAALLSAAAHQALGEAATGLNNQATAVRRLKELGVVDGRLVAALLEAAAARAGLGLAADAEQLVAQALGAAEALAHQQGLKEQLEHSELVSLYTPATPLLLAALLSASRHRTGRAQLLPAELLLRAAVRLLGCCKAQPLQQAEVLLELARVLRLQVQLAVPATAGTAKPQQLPAAAWLVWDKLPLTALTGPSSSSAVAVGSLGGGVQTAVAELVATASSGPTQRRLEEASQCLSKCLQLMAAEAKCCHGLVRSCCLESLTLLSAAAAAAAAPSGSNSSSGMLPQDAQDKVVLLVASAAAAAQAAADKRRALTSAPARISSTAAAPGGSDVNNSSNCPPWVVEYVAGQERLALQQQEQQQAAITVAAAKGGLSGTTTTAAPAAAGTKGGKPGAGEAAGGAAGAAPVNISEQLLARLVLQRCVELTGAGGSGQAQGWSQQQAAAAQQLLGLQEVTRVLLERAGAGEALWKEVPAVVGAKPLPGTVVAQWYSQPLCRQVPASWTLEGSLAPSTAARPLSKGATSSSSSGDGVPGLQAAPVSLEQVLAFRPGRRFASLLLVVVVPGVGGPWWKVGELAVELDRLARVREQVLDLARRLAAPAAPGALFGRSTPIEPQLAAAKHQLDCLLADIAELDMQPPPKRLPDPPPATPSALAQVVDATPPTSGGKGKAGGGGAGKKGGTAAAAAAAAASAGDAGKGGVPGDMDPGGVDWRGADVWKQLSVLLDVSGGGGSAVDGPLAKYLSSMLPSSSWVVQTANSS